MPRRISWKKGMRLTDDVLRAADQSMGESVSQALMLGAAGRFGLIPSPKPFALSLSVTKGFVDVEALSCLAITRGGDLIDAQFDAKFSNTIDTRARIPEGSEEKELFLTINAEPDQWHDTTDGYQEPTYTFAVVTGQQGIGPHAMPIARLVNEEGWREDNTNFVPPCLYVSSHPRLVELHAKFVSILRAIDEKSRQQLDTLAKTAIRTYWPLVQQVLIATVTEEEVLTPQRFLAQVQRVVAAFTAACDLDEVLNLEDAQTFRNYTAVAYSYRNGYLRIKQGMGMCMAIGEKIDKFALLRQAPAPEPPKPEPPRPQPKPRSWNGPNI